MVEDALPQETMPAEAIRGKERRSGKERRKALERKRSTAKIGMTVSLGSLVATGFMRGRGAKNLHIISGIALIGFSYWHHALYLPRNSDKNR